MSRIGVKRLSECKKTNHSTYLRRQVARPTYLLRPLFVSRRGLRQGQALEAGKITVVRRHPVPIPPSGGRRQYTWSQLYIHIGGYTAQILARLPRCIMVY